MKFVRKDFKEIKRWFKNDNEILQIAKTRREKYKKNVFIAITNTLILAKVLLFEKELFWTVSQVFMSFNNNKLPKVLKW